MDFLTFVPLIISTFYFLGVLVYLPSIKENKGALFASGHWFIFVGSLIHTAFLLYNIFVGLEGTQIYYSNLLLTFSLINILFYFKLMQKQKPASYTIVIPAFSFLLIYLAKILGPYQLFNPNDSQTFTFILNLISLLHVVGMLIGVLFFSGSFFLSLLFLFNESRLKQKKVNLQIENDGLDGQLKLIFRSGFLGFLFLSLGLLMGMIVGRTDPADQNLITTIIRYASPLISWAIYGTMILNCSVIGLRGKFLARMSIYGFVFVLASLFLEVFILKAI